MAIPTSVYAEMTPNPAVMKFVADRLLIEGRKKVEGLEIFRISKHVVDNKMKER